MSTTEEKSLAIRVDKALYDKLQIRLKRTGKTLKRYLSDLIEDDIRKNESAQQPENIDTNIGVLMGDAFKWQKGIEQSEFIKNTSIDDLILSKAFSNILQDVISQAVKDAIGKSQNKEKR